MVERGAGEPVRGGAKLRAAPRFQAGGGRRRERAWGRGGPARRRGSALLLTPSSTAGREAGSASIGAGGEGA